MLVEINNLSKKFTSLALNDISASFPKGKIIGIVGPDGSGKTTLIRLMAGLLKPTEGTISVEGYDTIKDSVFIYDLPLRGSWLLLAGVSALFLFCALGLGLMISTLTKNQVFAYQITLIVAFLPAYILSGFLFEIQSMPEWIQFITYIIPAKYFVQSLQSIFLVGNVWDLILFNMIPIVGIGLLFFMITALKTVKRLD